MKCVIVECELKKLVVLGLFIVFAVFGYSQNTIRGTVYSAQDQSVLIGANVVVKGTGKGVNTDWDGNFSLTVSEELPFFLEISYIGYQKKEVLVEDFSPLRIFLSEDASLFETIEISESRILDRQREAPLTVGALDIIGIKQTASSNFYEGLGSLKGVDLITASMGFTIVNTRGFNSTSPVRSLQLIDGIDNQAPGLNFSLGNFLGTSELDLQRVEVIHGASSAFYGPNAFNGVVRMTTKNPFIHRGISAQVKMGERNLVETAVRWADVFTNSEGNEYLAYKVNLSYLKANDWEADNYDPVFGTATDQSNPGGYDAVNIYGDEYRTSMDLSKAQPSSPFAGLGQWHRQGYREVDLVDYNTRNLKSNIAFYLRTQPDNGLQSPELKFSNSFSQGTTVYQGDNRFSLKNIKFFQSSLEFQKTDRYFVRGYVTVSDAGDSYDPYFTALRLQTRAKANSEWSTDYSNFWIGSNGPRKWMDELGYPKLQINPNPPPFTSFDREAAENWILTYRDSLARWHQLAAEIANKSGIGTGQNFFEPGTERFQQEFDQITSTLNNDSLKGTRFFDRSALYHLHGEYKFFPLFLDDWVVGANFRYYAPRSKGTIFSDSDSERITNSEFGVYTGLTKKLFNNEVSINTTLRIDKNENFSAVFSPAVSVVWKTDEGSYLRATFTSALRNPTLTDQYLRLDVGPAILSGNLNGVENLITVESFNDFRNSLDGDLLEFFDIDPVKPERVRTFELGYRTTLFEQIYLDAGYYYSVYNDFLGFNIGIDAEFRMDTNLPTSLQVFRYSANSTNKVTTQGFNVGINYYLSNYYQISANYSWNRLNTEVDDPIIPAFNTPEHKFNLGFSGRSIPVGTNRKLGFNLNYKWLETFLFEGSPQFTGPIETHGSLNAQVNVLFQNLNTTFKLGASNLLDNKVFQSYGGPRIGRMLYLTITYELNKNIF